MISFIVPAHNEEFCLPKTLEAIFDSARVLGEAHEVIVVDDASTDGTGDIARQHKATVIRVAHRQIAATRNSGARAARGERLFFVDADTTVNPAVIQSALRWMDKGAAGGGALTRFEGAVPLYARLLLLWLGFFMRLASLTGGAFMFCTREAFQATGGFDERLYGAEDAAMSAALRREGRFVVLRQRILTSGRRVRAIPGLQTLALLVRIAFVPGNLKSRSSVENVWYNSNRDGDKSVSYSLADRVSNGLALVILSAMVSFPIWAIPWPQVLLDGPLGTLRSGARIILAHVVLVLWPCSFFLLRNVFRKATLVERFRAGALGILSLGLACRATLRVYGLWGSLIHCLIERMT